MITVKTSRSTTEDKDKDIIFEEKVESVVKILGVRVWKSMSEYYCTEKEKKKDPIGFNKKV